MKIMIRGALIPTGLLVLSPGYALSINSSIFGEVNDRFHRFTHNTSVFGESADAVSVRNTAATASFNLQPGVLRGQSRVTGDPGPNGSSTGLAWATAFAGYAESITLDSPGLSGLTGQISADIWVSYQFSGSGARGGIGASTLEVFTQLGEDERRVQYSTPGHESFEDYEYLISNSPGALVHLTTSFVFGQAFELELSIFSMSSGIEEFDPLITGAHFDATSEFALLWAGVSSVTTVDGRSVSDYLIRSETGIDYRPSFLPPPSTPIPEPATYSIAGALALATLCLARRKRNSTRPTPRWPIGD